MIFRAEPGKSSRHNFSYPATRAARDRFVLERRGARATHDPWRHQGVIVEDEPAQAGGTTRVATVFLTGRECPWRCAMCDLWLHTTEADTPVGAIPAQVSAARSELIERGERVAALKLYNAGSFFDPRAVPEEDYDAVAHALCGLSRVIVESHPALVGRRVDRFLASLDANRPPDRAAIQLEVAMGLETAHPAALDRLNKRITPDTFAEAAAALRARDIALRVFLLISPPFVPEREQDIWLARSIDFALDCGATVISLIPTRDGNGTMASLEALGEFTRPDLEAIERSAALALDRARGRGRVLVDLWDLDRFTAGAPRASERVARLAAMNLAQREPLS
jgi:radical SAM enzyme (TIGR01210 family)